MRSRPSTLPMKVRPPSAAPASSAWVSLTSGLPFVASSPIDSRPTLGSAMPYRSWAKTAPIWANCTSHSGWHSALAPASSRTVGVPPGTGIGVAIAGRLTPLIRPMRSSAEAMVAPVLPADTMADALPSRTASAARTSDESFIVRTLDPGSASMAITSDAGMTSSPWSVPSSSGRPTSTTGTPSSAAARTALDDLARRLVATHRVDGDGQPAHVGLVDVDGLAAVVPAAVRAHDVGQLGGAAPGADAARRARRASRRSPAGCGSWPWRSSSSGRPCRLALAHSPTGRSLECRLVAGASLADWRSRGRDTVHAPRREASRRARGLHANSGEQRALWRPFPSDTRVRTDSRGVSRT